MYLPSLDKRLAKFVNMLVVTELVDGHVKGAH